MEPLSPPLEKGYPTLSQLPPSKSWDPIKSPLLKIWLDVQPPPPHPSPNSIKGGCRLCIRSWRAKNALKLSLKYLKDRIWKIKQYWNYILMIINQNILAIPQTFLNLKKKLWNSTPSELPQLLLLNLFAKFLTERKYLMNTFIFVRLKYL